MATAQSTVTGDGGDIAVQLTSKATELAREFEPRQAQAREQRRLPSENVEAMRAAGLYRVYNPDTYGGYQLHMQSVLPMVVEIAKGCPASAWVLAIYQVHAWVLSLMPKQAQQEVFGENPDVAMCASLNPSKNSAQKVDGGFLIEKGSFDFCSGCDAREWAMFGAMIKDDGGAVVDVGCVLVPGNEVTKFDDWFVSGLQGTGSCSLIAENVFVPEHRFLSYPKATGYQAPGSVVNTGSLYKSAFVPMLVLNLGGAALGIAECAVADFGTALKARGQSGGSYPLAGQKRIDSAATHIGVAEATMKVDVARMVFDKAGEQIRVCADGEQMSRELAAKVCFQTSYATRECMDAVRMLLLQSGGGVIQTANAMQQAYQDVIAVNVHGFLSHEAQTALYGSFVLGHENPQAFL